SIFFEFTQRQDLRGSIVVPIIRTDNQLIFARILQHVRKIVIGLASDIDSVFAKHVLLVHLLSTPLEAPGKVMNRVGHPLRTYLDKSKLGLGKLFRDLVENQGVERAYHRELEFGKPPFVKEQIMHHKASSTLLHA